MKPITLLVAALFGLAVAHPAFAQAQAAGQAQGQTHKADALFNAGRSLLEAGEYAEACPKFAESNSLAPGLGVTLYLADCYERLGKTNSALLWFRHAVELAHERRDRREPVAAGRAEALVARIPKLAIAVNPAAVAQQVRVVLDGSVVAAATWGTASSVDPGDHVLEVTAEGKIARRTTFRLAPNAETHIETVGPLDAPAAAAPVAVVVPPPAEVPMPPPAPPRNDRTYLAVAATSVGVGVVALGVGAALGAVASSKLSDSNNGPCNAANQCTPSGLADRSSAIHTGNIATVAFVVGGVAVATGAVVFLVRPRQGSATPSVGLSPVLGPGSAGMNLGGAF